MKKKNTCFHLIVKGKKIEKKEKQKKRKNDANRF